MIDPVALLQDLVRIPSVNPAFPSADPATTGEARLAGHLAGWLAPRGFAVEIDEVLPHRPALFATLPGKGERFLCLTAHLDTVPGEGMRIPPFGGELVGGRVQGRGTVDTKGSLAAMIAAAFAEAETPGRPPLLLAFTCDEESGVMHGARRLGERYGSRIGAAVVGEPTGLSPARAHKGVLDLRLVATGQSAHASTPEAGVNAIYRMGRALTRLEELAGTLAARTGHPLLGAPRLNVGLIRGGAGTNIVPERCTAEIDRRLLPGETPEGAVAEIAASLSGIEGLELGDTTLVRPAFEIAAGHPWTRAALAALGLSEASAVPYATDACVLAASGVPCLVCGPGRPEEAHTAEESLSCGELARAVEVYRAFVRAGQRFLATA